MWRSCTRFTSMWLLICSTVRFCCSPSLCRIPPATCWCGLGIFVFFIDFGSVARLLRTIIVTVFFPALHASHSRQYVVGFLTNRPFFDVGPCEVIHGGSFLHPLQQYEIVSEPISPVLLTVRPAYWALCHLASRFFFLVLHPIQMTFGSSLSSARSSYFLLELFSSISFAELLLCSFRSRLQ